MQIGRFINKKMILQKNLLVVRARFVYTPGCSGTGAGFLTGQIPAAVKLAREFLQAGWSGDRVKKQVFCAGLFLLLIMILPAAALPVVGISDDRTCYVYDGYGTLVPAHSETIVAGTAGVAVLTCDVTLPETPVPQDSVLIFDGENNGSCSTALGLSSHWQEVITPDGKVSMVCNNQYSELLKGRT